MDVKKYLAAYDHWILWVQGFFLSSIYTREVFGAPLPRLRLCTPQFKEVQKQSRKNGNRADRFEWGEMGSWVITCNPYLWSCRPLLIWLLGACFVVSTMAVSTHLTGHGIIASAGHWPCPPLPTRHGMNESSHCWVAIQLDHCFYNIWCLKSLNQMYHLWLKHYVNGRVIYIFKILWSSLFRRSMNETNNPTQKCALAGFQYSEWRCPHFAWSVDRINVAVTGLSSQRQRVLRFSQSYIWKMWCMIALLISAFWKPRRQGVRTGWGRQCLAVPHRLTRDDTKWCILQTVFVPHLPHDLPTWSFCSDLTRILTISIGIRFLRIPDSFRIIQIVFRNETKARKWKTHPPQGPRCPS